jgi:hypothetical protein
VVRVHVGAFMALGGGKGRVGERGGRRGEAVQAGHGQGIGAAGGWG